ncbi:MAG: plastocyanin/azurin family copper-binding protein [Thermoleophilaceae bacterium]
MKKWSAVMCAFLALGLVAVGCGGGGDDAGGGAATEETTTTETTDTSPDGDRQEGADGEAGGDQAEVDIVDIDYDPREIAVPAGTTITWTNTGDLPHTVTKEEGPGDDFDSGTLNPGDTYEQAFDTAGTIDYVCTIHANQRGSVTVEQ